MGGKLKLIVNYPIIEALRAGPILDVCDDDYYYYSITDI